MRALYLLLRRLLGKQTRIYCIVSIGCNNFADWIIHYSGADQRTRSSYCCSSCKRMIMDNSKYLYNIKLQSMASGMFVPMKETKP